MMLLVQNGGVKGLGGKGSRAEPPRPDWIGGFLGRYHRYDRYQTQLTGARKKPRIG